jgi:two-component system nitrate/nitrite response regulator NarL
MNGALSTGDARQRKSGKPLRDDVGSTSVANGCSVGCDASLKLLILSDIRFLREGLAEILSREEAFHTISVAADLGETLSRISVASPDIVLIDAALPNAISAVAVVRRLAPQIRVVALAVAETEAEVIAWAEAGVSGYVPRGAALGDLVGFLRNVMRGEQACSMRVAAGLLRWIANGSRAGTAPSARLVLTAREAEVVGLIGAGLSNKEIALRLNICLATTKSHVHNVLGKLGLRRRSQVSGWIRDHRAV